MKTKYLIASTLASTVLTAAALARADGGVFELQPVAGTAYLAADDGKAAEGSCGAGMKPAKAQEGGCGANKAKAAAKMPEASCGAAKAAAAAGKTPEGKCGGKTKAMDDGTASGKSE